MLVKRALMAIITSLAMAAIGFPQLQAPPPPPPPLPPQQSTSQATSVRQTLRVTSRLVQVTVVVQDKEGRPVSGLTKDDFKIFDEGQPRSRLQPFPRR